MLEAPALDFVCDQDFQESQNIYLAFRTFERADLVICYPCHRVTSVFVFIDTKTPTFTRGLHRRAQRA